MAAISSLATLMLTIVLMSHHALGQPALQNLKNIRAVQYANVVLAECQQPAYPSIIRVNGFIYVKCDDSIIYVYDATTYKYVRNVSLAAIRKHTNDVTLLGCESSNALFFHSFHTNGSDYTVKILKLDLNTWAWSVWKEFNHNYRPADITLKVQLSITADCRVLLVIEDDPNHVKNDLSSSFYILDPYANVVYNYNWTWVMYADNKFQEINTAGDLIVYGQYYLTLQRKTGVGTYEHEGRLRYDPFPQDGLSYIKSLTTSPAGYIFVAERDNEDVIVLGPLSVTRPNPRGEREIIKNMLAYPECVYFHGRLQRLLVGVNNTAGATATFELKIYDITF